LLEHEIRDVIYLNITKITPNGEVTIQFSEKLLDIEELGESGVNMTILNVMKG